MKLLTVFLTSSSLFCGALSAIGGTELSTRQAEAASLENRQFGSIPASLCATELLCCNSVTRAGDPSTATILALLGINIAPSYTVGLTCSPITVVGVGSGSQCSAQPVCCWWGAEYAYIVAIGCTPVDLEA